MLRWLKRHWWQCVLGISLIPTALIILCSILLYIPKVQDTCRIYIALQASQALDKDVSIGKLRLYFPLEIEIGNLLVKHSPQDTLLSLDELHVQISPLHLFRKKIFIPKLSISECSYAMRDSLGGQNQVLLKKGEALDLSIDLKKEQAQLSTLVTDGLEVQYLSPREYNLQEDENTSFNWTFGAELIALNNSKLHLNIGEQKALISTNLNQLRLHKLSTQLDSLRISLANITLKAKDFSYFLDRQDSTNPYLDYQNVSIQELEIHLSHILSQGPYLDVFIEEISGRERSGFTVAKLRGLYQMDSLRMRLSDLELRTDASSGLYGHLDLPWAIFRGDTSAILEAKIDLNLSMQDFKTLAGQSLLSRQTKLSHIEHILSKSMLKPITLQFDALGTLNDLQLYTAQLSWQNVLHVDLTGKLYKLLDNRTRRGTVRLSMQLGNKTQTLLPLIGEDIASNYTIPQDFSLNGDLDISQHYFNIKAQAKQADGIVDITGLYDYLRQDYGVRLHLNQMDLRNYTPLYKFGRINVLLDFSGKGFNPLNPKTTTQALARINSLEYGDKTLTDISLDASLEQGALSLSLNSFNAGMDASLQLDGLLSSERIQSNVLFSCQDINLRDWGITDLALASRFRLQGDLYSDLKESHRVSLSLEDIFLKINDKDISPKQIDLKLESSTDRSFAQVSSGDLRLKIDIGESPTKLSRKSEKLARLLTHLVNEVRSSDPMHLRLEDISRELPSADIDLELGTNNALCSYLSQLRLSVEQLEGQLRLRPSYGIQGHFIAKDLRQDTLRLSCIDLSLSTNLIPRLGSSYADSMRLQCTFRLDKQRFRRQEGFSIAAELDASLQDLDLRVHMLGERAETLHKAHVAASWGADSYLISFPSDYLSLSAQKLKLNSGNYFRVQKDNHLVDANVVLSALGDNTQIKLLAHRDEVLGQVANVSILGLGLERYRSLGLPDISGKLFAELNYNRPTTPDAQTVVNGDVSIQNLSYGSKPLGHFASAFFYEPRNDNSHYITAEMSYRGTQALSLNAIYKPRDDREALQGNVHFLHFPLELANPFSAPFATYLTGTLKGTFQLGGTLSKPLFTGSISAVQGAIDLKNYATTLQLDSLPILYEGERLRLNNFSLYPKAAPNKPIYLNGYINTHGDKPLYSELRLRSTETMIMNQEHPRLEGQLLYGRLLSSADISLKGKLNALKVRGELNIKNGTNCTYAMQQSPLEIGDKTMGLVRFVDFADTLFTARPVTEAEFGGLDVGLTIRIEPLVRFNVDLSQEYGDYLRMQGGGALQLRYLPYGEMNLRGRYEMSSGGTLQYTLPVVGTKTFNIKKEGYIAFDGDLSNPYINLSATQKLRANTGDEARTKTNFLVSINLKDKLERIDLSFDLSAPEDLNLQNTLNTMTAEERGKHAIGLLATGVYLGANTGDKFNLNETLSGLIQSQINAMAGKLLKGTDLSIGMEQDNDSSGGQQTSYSYSFSRRFYNDRIRFVVGGKIHTGTRVSSREQRLIDNIALEYQLDKRGERFLQVYHKQVTDNILEGEYSETGLGLYLRRKLSKLSDVLRFRIQTPRLSDDLDTPIKSTEFVLPQLEVKP